MVEEGAALEPLPREAKGFDGLELPRSGSDLGVRQRFDLYAGSKKADGA